MCLFERNYRWKFSFDSVTRIARIERRLLDADRKATRATFIRRIDAISKTGNVKQTTVRTILGLLCISWPVNEQGVKK